MARRSLNRDILEAKMKNNPEQRTNLLINSKHQRHQKEAAEMTKRVASAIKKASEVVEEAKKED